MISETHLIGYVAGTLTTLSFLPQTIMTLRTRDTRSLSLIMYSLFVTGISVWLVYGFLQSDPALIATNIVTLMLAVPILIMKVINTLNPTSPDVVREHQ